VQLIGVAVIFLLIASQNIASLLSEFVFHFCDYTILITLIMFPVSMLGTPKDFWPIAVGAMAFTGIACSFIFTETLRQIPAELPAGSAVTFESFFVGFGTILFCFGGGVMFPTIQTDMIQPGLFYKSVIIAYFGKSPTEHNFFSAQ
jgi:vesicular inhibitory amino acid transporter